MDEQQVIVIPHVCSIIFPLPR